MIIVTGCDGSGTSAIVRVLQQFGVDFPGPYTWPEGENFENVEARRINDRIMVDLTGKKWGGFPKYLDLVGYDTRVTDSLGDVNWKDPRANITLPVWRAWRPKVVWVKRSPSAVASTWLNRRKEYPRPGYTRRHHVYKFIINSEGFLFTSLGRFEIEHVTTCYEDWWKDRNLEEVLRVLMFCRATWQSDKDVLKALKNMRRPIHG